MNNYIPFLKLKRNEISALKNLSQKILNELTVFFDFPASKDLTADEFIKKADSVYRSIKKNLCGLNFYLDTYDIDSSLIINGNCCYQYLIDKFNGLPIVPVTGIDREPEHQMVIIDAVQNHQLSTERIALRISETDYQSFATIRQDVNDILNCLNLFDEIDLILDSRIYQDLSSVDYTSTICNFIDNFAGYCNDNAIKLGKIIISGSSIPASIRDVAEPNSSTIVERAELFVYQNVLHQIDRSYNLFLGDYGITSPDYSDLDIPKTAMLKVLAPRIIYSYDNLHYISRGGAIQTHARGFSQYNDQANTIISNDFYRGSDYSWGDDLLYEIGYNSKGTGPGSIIAPALNTHITYMFCDYTPEEH